MEMRYNFFMHGDNQNPQNDGPRNEHIVFMRKALQLAVKGAGWTAPNPMVGAVIVKEGRVIGAGYHRRFGGDHAEVEAIRDCRKKGYETAGGTMYVTLEPCCHYGKTPPCTAAIIEAGIQKVVAATLDETEKVCGKGIKELEANHIEVEVGCCEKQAKRLNAGFFKLNRLGRPKVILKWAQSLDGKICWPKHLNKRWITGEAARRDVHRLRSRCGAILVGIGTLLTDNPELTVRLGRKCHQPLRAVLDSQLRIPLDSKLLQTRDTGPIVVYTCREAVRREVEKSEVLAKNGIIIVEIDVKAGLLNPGAVLDDLGGRGVTDLLVEGGAMVHNSFIENELADMIIVYTAPVFIGDGEGAKGIVGVEKLGKIEVIDVEKFGMDMRIECDLV
jgi:diaminohydroxyphosphoribosylaminopyrimidine deaminase / 5-amino-6-(5-phosphoribosylamino)uracil reductase